VLQRLYDGSSSFSGNHWTQLTILESDDGGAAIVDLGIAETASTLETSEDSWPSKLTSR
jgi:hypothetical protein